MMSPAEVFNWIIEAIRRLFTTPINGWTWGQWFLALVLLSVASSCCSSFLCCCRGRRRRRRQQQRGYSRNGRDDFDGYYSSNRARHPSGDGSSDNNSNNSNINSNININSNSNNDKVTSTSTAPQHRQQNDDQKWNDSLESTPYRLAEDV